MKKEFIFIAVLLLLLSIGYWFKSFYIESKYNDLKKNLESTAKLKAEFERDSLISLNTSNIEQRFILNSRGDKSTLQTYVEIMAFFENLLKSTKIEYSNDALIQNEEITENGVSFIGLTLKFKADNLRLSQFLNSLYNSDRIITIDRLNISRVENNFRDDNQVEGKSDYFSYKLLDIQMDINVLKFL
ncbi:MAG: hypothetical protein JXR48_06825 [Candidatus Delongbacteria bacterium]|nr:hypothetical protein [Candidatus Delongbacteria bacterium]MBN2834664.1 hypothetical protein [Candidatus Delongbacteria bacterium]